MRYLVYSGFIWGSVVARVALVTYVVCGFVNPWFVSLLAVAVVFSGICSGCLVGLMPLLSAF